MSTIANMQPVRVGDGYLQPRLPKIEIGNAGRGDGGDPHYTPWLVIRDAAGDVGNRPLAAGTTFWESPDVWVVSSLGINQPVPGEPNTVYCRITNLGLEDATGVVVRFWWANPSLAITQANAHQINPAQLPAVMVPAQSSVEVQCPQPWIPVVENNGHECLLAEAYIPAFDPLVAPLDPVDDRHVGQKNEQLVLVSPGQPFKLQLDALNIAPLAQALTFEVHPLRLEALPEWVVLRQVPTIVPPAAALPVSLELHDDRRFTGPSALFARRLLADSLREIDGTARFCTAPAQATLTASFAPWELRTLEVTAFVPPDARPGQSFAFRVVQRAGYMVCGGYTVLAVVAK